MLCYINICPLVIGNFFTNLRHLSLIGAKKIYISPKTFRTEDRQMDISNVQSFITTKNISKSVLQIFGRNVSQNRKKDNITQASYYYKTLMEPAIRNIRVLCPLRSEAILQLWFVPTFVIFVKQFHENGRFKFLTLFCLFFF